MSKTIKKLDKISMRRFTKRILIFHLVLNVFNLMTFVDIQKLTS